MKATTQEQPKDPKWWDENAPKGATHAIFGDFTRWLMLDHGIWRFWEGGWWSRPSAKPAGEILARPTKPPAPEWNGEGLPPAGIQCECYHADLNGVKQWIECDVVGPYGDYVICAPNGGGFYGFDANELRPLRTKEQRERDELEQLLFDHGVMNGHCAGAADAIIAAGWRKVEQ